MLSGPSRVSSALPSGATLVPTTDGIQQAEPASKCGTGPTAAMG